MSTLTGREYGIIAGVLAEVAEQPGIDVDVMRKVIRYAVCAVIDDDPLILHPVWFRDRIMGKLTQLQNKQVTLPVPEGVSPHTKVVSLDQLCGTGS